MNKVQKSGLALAAVCAVGATAVLFGAGSHQACCTSVGGWSIDWLKTLLSLGGVSSLPALLPKLFEYLKAGLAYLKIGGGTKFDDGLIGAAEIAVYAKLVVDATTPDVRAGLVAAGRAACDKMREDLFPLVPAAPVKP